MTNALFKFGSYLIEPASRKLKHDDNAVSITPMSFDWLVYLTEYRDRAAGQG